MKQIVSTSLIIVWIILCPILSLFASSIVQESSHLSTYTQRKHISSGSKHDIAFDQVSLLDDEGDPDLFAVGLKYILTPQYFLLLTCVALLFQSSIFFKRKLPFCAFLASISRYRYLSIRTFLI